MKRIIDTEVAVILLAGFLLTFAGIYLNFQNLDAVMSKIPEDPGVIKNNEAMYGLIQIMGMAIIFVGVMRGVLKRADLMTGKFVNIMDVFTSLIKREIDTADDRASREKLRELSTEGERFKSELRGRRI